MSFRVVEPPFARCLRNEVAEKHQSDYYIVIVWSELTILDRAGLEVASVTRQLLAFEAPYSDEAF